jgi:hypothetical protein
MLALLKSIIGRTMCNIDMTYVRFTLYLAMHSVVQSAHNRRSNILTSSAKPDPDYARIHPAVGRKGFLVKKRHCAKQIMAKLRQAPNECSLRAVCTEATCRYEPNKHAWGWMTKPGTPWQEEVTELISRDNWFIHQENAWLDTLEYGVTPLCTVEEALQTLYVNRAALASAVQGGAWQMIDEGLMS